MNHDLSKKWKELHKIFEQKKVKVAALPADTSSNDYVTLLPQSPAWQKACELTQSLPINSVLSLIEMSKVNSTHISKDLAFAVGFLTVPLLFVNAVTSVHVLVAALGLEYPRAALDIMIEDMGLPLTMKVKAGLTVFINFIVFFIVLPGAVFHAVRLWLKSRRAMQLTTCLQTILAIKRDLEAPNPEEPTQ